MGATDDVDLDLVDIEGINSADDASPECHINWRLKCKVRLLIDSHTMTPFDTPGKQAFWKHCGKREIARNEQFLLFPQCFLPIWIAFCHFRQIWNCCLQTLSV